MFLIGIAGGSGSGKTTFARKIYQQVLDESVGILHQDSYYLPEPPKKFKQEENFDHPDCFDWKLLHMHLSSLKEGRKIEVPTYDFKTSRRQSDTQPLGPCKAVIVEGIYALWDSEVRDLMDLRVFLSVESDIRFIRRLHRDVKERGRNLDGIIRQYYSTVRPMHHEFLAPTEQYADIIVGEDNDRAADLIASKVKLALHLK